MFCNVKNALFGARIGFSRGKILHAAANLFLVHAIGCASALPINDPDDGDLSSEEGTDFFTDLDTQTMEEETGENGTEDESTGSEENTESAGTPDTMTDNDTDTQSEHDTSTPTEPESDQCPEDESKTEPGLCGCGMEEGTCVVSCANGNGRLDSSTNLCWQEPAPENPLTWQGAFNYCDNLSLGGIANWRLPSYLDFTLLLGGCDPDLFEAKDGYCHTCEDSPMCNEMFPLDTKGHWSQVTLVDGTAWVANFLTGRLHTVDRLKERNFRCVSP